MKPHPIRRYCPGLLFLLGGLLLAPGAAAQIPVLEVKDSGGIVLMQVNDDAGLLANGAFGVGVIPATGPGERLMWYPGKGAFRAGRALTTEWDDANVGEYSVAMGFNTTASGTRSTAIGNATTASGSSSVAMGAGTIASGTRSMAMGSFTTASGDWSTAMGGSTTTASGLISTAMGAGATASGDASTAMGSSTTASGLSSTAMGDGTTASGSRSTAMGNNTTAQAYASLVLGQWNVITGTAGSWVSTDPVLVVGNGSSNLARANALTLFKDGNLTIAGTLTELSDRRLKRDIHPLTNARDGLARLLPVRFRFREGTSRPEGVHIGLIAQEVAGVFPELVRQGADGYWSVSYANLSAVLVQALNEQQAEMEVQQAQMEAQQAALEALRAEVAALRAAIAFPPAPAAVAHQ